MQSRSGAPSHALRDALGRQPPQGEPRVGNGVTFFGTKDRRRASSLGLRVGVIVAVVTGVAASIALMVIAVGGYAIDVAWSATASAVG